MSAAMKCRATEEDMQMIFSKKRKLYSEIENDYCGDVELEENSVSPAASRTSSHDDSNGIVRKNLRSLDLECEVVEKEISASTGRLFSREATPTSEFSGDSEQVLDHISSTSQKKSLTPPTILRRKIQNSAAEIMPSAEELEEFFVAAEKHEQKRFTEKYNYDIVKDVPLEGKYQWVRLQPSMNLPLKKKEGIF